MTRQGTGKAPARIVIDSDGDGRNTRVTTEDGTPINWIEHIDLSIDARGVNTAKLHVINIVGRINAEVESIKERLVPEPSRVLTVTVSQALVGDRSKIVVTRKTNRGTDHTLVETVCEGWVSACEPFELTVPEEGT